MKKLSCSVQMIILKVTMFFYFIILYAKYFIYRCRYEKIKPQLCAFRKELKKRYEIAAHIQKLKLTLPDFLSNWAYYKPIIMLEQFLGCAPFVALCLLPYIVLQFYFILFLFFSGTDLQASCRVFYRMDKNLNSTGRQTVKPNIRNNYNANMMTLFVVVVS